MHGVLTVKSRYAVLAVAIVITAGLVFLYWDTYSMDPPLLPGYPGDALFPRLVIGFTLVWAAILLARLLTGRAIASEDEQVSFDWLEFVVISVLIAAFAALSVPVGFEVVTTVFMAALLIPRLRLSWPAAIAVGSMMAVLTTLVVWLIFGVMLKVPLPLKFLPLYLTY